MFHWIKQSPFALTPTAATWTPGFVPEPVFLKLIHIATKRVLFRFNNTMYQQVIGISIVSLLGTALANIFVGFQEARLFEITNMPLSYKRYVEDTFVIFSLRSESRRFFHTIKQLHPGLTFTCDFEHNNSLPFLHVFVERTNFGVQTSIYRKLTFTGSYTWWRSSCKITLLKTLDHRALMTCPKPKLSEEIYQDDFIEEWISRRYYSHQQT